MSQQVWSFLKSLGLSPAAFLGAVAFAGAWYQTISPIPSEMRSLNRTIQDLSTKVEIHSVLIGQMSEIKAELTSLRKELSTVEGRLAHLKGYQAP